MSSDGLDDEEVLDGARRVSGGAGVTGQFQVQSWVYFVGESWEGRSRAPIKIGVAKRPELRLHVLQNGYPYQLEVIAAFRGGFHEEYRLHRALGSLRLCGEWFRREGQLGMIIRRLLGKHHGWLDPKYAWVLDRERWSAPPKKKREKWIYDPDPETRERLGLPPRQTGTPWEAQQ